MPVIRIHLAAGRYDDELLGDLQRGCAECYADVLRAPMERIRVFVSEHRPETVFVDGRRVADGADDAPFFDFVVLAGRPQGEIEALMRGFTDIIHTVLGVDRGRIRGVCRPASPEHWGIAGTMAAVARADEVAARADAAPPPP